MPTTDWNAQVKTGSNLYPIDRPVSGAPTAAPAKTPTVLTDATFREDTRPKLDSRLNALIGLPTAQTQTERQGTESDFWSESGGTKYSEDPAQNSLLTSMRQTVDEQTGQMLDAISEQFNVRRQQQENANKGAENTRSRALLLSGASRYAPLTAIGLNHAQESYGLSQIADLDAQERMEIAKAKQYQMNKQYDLMDKALTNAETRRKEKQAEATKLADKLAEENKKVRDAEIRASRDSAIADLVQQGITDPATVLDMLNYDDKGTLIGDFTAKEVNDTLKGFNDAMKESATEKGFKLTPSDYTTLLGSGLSMPDIDAAMDVIKTKGYNALIPVLTPEEKKIFDSVFLGKDAASKAQGITGGIAGFDKFANEQIALSVIPVQLRNTEVELNRFLEGIRVGLENGMTPYEVADSLMGYKINQPTDFSNGLRQYFAPAGLDSSQISDVARLINSGANDKAIAVIENAAYKQAKTNLGDEYMSETAASYANQKSNAIEKQIEKLGEDSPVGVVKGTMENWLGRFRGSDAAAVRAQITSLVADMRNRLSGTAVTESEKAFLEPLIPSLSDSPANFAKKLEELRNNPLSQLNRVRAQYQLPELSPEQLMDRKLRIPLYQIDSETSAKVNDPDGLFEGIEDATSNNPGGI